jgi:hypothetical protein
MLRWFLGLLTSIWFNILREGNLNKNFGCCKKLRVNGKIFLLACVSKSTCYSIALKLHNILSKCSNRIKPYVLFSKFSSFFFAFLFIVDLLVLEVLGEVQWRKLKNSSHFGWRFSVAYFFCIFWKIFFFWNADEGCEVGILDSFQWKYLRTRVYFEVKKIETWVDKSKF